MQSKYIINNDTIVDILKYPHKYAVKPFKIAGNLYYVGNSTVSSHLIDTGDGLILIDTTFPHTYPLLINSIWEAGFSVYDIKYILHSHGHIDHFGGTTGLVALSGARTFLGVQDAQMFRERPELSMAFECPFCYVELFTPDVEMEDGQLITLGNTQIRAVSTPGHSPGVCSFFFTVTEGSSVYTVGMQGGAGLNTLNRQFLEFYHLDIDGTRNSFVDGIKKLENEQVDITLGNHPSHNTTLQKQGQRRKNPDAPNPFINPAEWRVHLADILDKFHTMLDEEG